MQWELVQRAESVVMPSLVLLPLLSASVDGFANENHYVTQFVGGSRCHLVHLRHMCLVALFLPSIHVHRQIHQSQTSRDSTARVPCALIFVDTSPLLNSISFAVASYRWRMALRSCDGSRTGEATNYNTTVRHGIRTC